MSIQDQLDKIRAKQIIDDIGDDEARKVFRAAVNAFRKWLSPVRSPANTWISNVQLMLIKCRLENDPLCLVELMAIRAAAQMSATVQPGNYDELAVAAGLDVVTSSKMIVGNGGQICINEDIEAQNGYRIVFDGIPLVIHDAPITGELITDDITEAVKAIDSMSQRNTGGAIYVEVKYDKAPVTSLEIFDTVHDPWKPTTVYSTELKAHPTKIIEPSTLAATPYPPATYKPLLPAEAIKRGFISDAQFETIVYALQAVTTYLPGSPKGQYERTPKGGFIIGDGTGVGKTNEIMGIIMDQWMRGIRRHIIVVERGKHVPHIQEAWKMIGGNPKDIFYQGDTGASEAIPDRDGVLVTTYALIRDQRRYDALLEWANSRREMNGILAFDEAHNMRNAVEDNHEEGSGKKNQSEQGMRGVELQNDLPEAGVIYASATMATDVYNLGYAPRLGLWGHNAPFRNEASFIGEMHFLDEAALEQICIDLKAAGRYCSRTLSFDGVEYEEVIHKLTPHQRQIFDTTIKNWKILFDMTQNSINKAGGNGYRTKGRLTQMRRALVEQTLSGFNVETLIADIHSEIAQGNAPVVQIAYTGEAKLKRIAAGRTYIPKDQYLEEEVINWIKNNFPETKLVYDKTMMMNVPKLDSNGNPIIDVDLVKEKQKALQLAESLAFRHSVLDRLLLEFGPDQVAEVTGRSVRAIPKMLNGEHVGWDIEERSSQAAMDDVSAFHDGKKPILVFSLAAGGTGLGYHSAEKSKNKSRRIHYIMELGRRAESAVQGLGRTHRSDQIIPPYVKMITSDVPAHAIHAAKTLYKISKMGALSRGHQHATTNAIFEQRIPIFGKYAQQGWTRTLNEIKEGKLGDMTIENLSRDMGIKDKGDNSIHALDVAINRLAVMTDNDQRILVGRLTENTEEAIATAIRQGTYNQGMETITASSIEIVDENEIQNANGSTTTYYRLRKKDEIEQVPFRKVATIMAAAKAKKNTRAVFMRHKVNGRICLGVLRPNSTVVDMYSPAGISTRMQDSLRQEPWKIIDNMEDAKRLWEREAETVDLRAETDLHVLSGSLLYNWDKLPKTGIGLNRCKTDNGQIIIGRVIAQKELRKTLGAMGMQSSYKPTQISSMLSKVDKGAKILIDNGWEIVSYGSSYKLNVPDLEQTGTLRRDLMSMGVIPHDNPLGYELEIPRADAITVIQNIAIGCDLSLEGTTASTNQKQKQDENV